jgi:F-type H+-transporting ATPase subunit alpha
LLAGLRESGAMKNTIVVLADIFDSLTQSYIAPYAGCAMAEYVWKTLNRDSIIIYDDLSSHAEAYRQLSLLQEVDPGRDSFPGDIFYAHSSLLERAGKLLSTNKTLTSLPVVLTPNDDITSYLSTNIMSITDGQIVFDLGVFRQGIRPAVKAGLSVSRVGGQAQTKREKLLSGNLFKKLAKYHQAEEFSHFGSSLSKDASIDLLLGKQIYAALQQPPEKRYTLVQQQLVLETIMKGEGKVEIDVEGLKTAAVEQGSKVKDVKDEQNFDLVEEELYKKFAKQPPVPEPPKPAAPAAPAAPVNDKDNKKEKAHAKS